MSPSSYNLDSMFLNSLVTLYRLTTNSEVLRPTVSAMMSLRSLRVRSFLTLILLENTKASGSLIGSLNNNSSLS